MKKTIRVLALLLCAVLLSGCCLKHEWKEATCEEPITCAKCGETLGDELDHHPGEWETVRLAMWGQDGLKVRKCLICGEVVEEQTEQLAPSYCDETFHMDIFAMIERMESVLLSRSDRYDCVLAGHPSVNLSIYIRMDEEMIGVCTFGVEGYYLMDDMDIPDEMELVGSMENLEEGTGLEDLALAFIACFDPTLSREDAEALAAEMGAYIRDPSDSGEKTFSGTGIDFHVEIYNKVFAFSPEKKA